MACGSLLACSRPASRCCLSCSNSSAGNDGCLQNLGHQTQDGGQILPRRLDLRSGVRHATENVDPGLEAIDLVLNLLARARRWCLA